MSRSRRAFTMVESCVAAVLLAAALGTVVGLLTSVARQRQAASLHAQAVLTADNLLERLTDGPYDSITSEAAEELTQTSAAAGELSDGAVQIRVADEQGTPPRKRIELEVAWRSGGGRASRHRVATWIFAKEGK